MNYGKLKYQQEAKNYVKMNHLPLDPLVHFIFIYYMAVRPGLHSIRITPKQLETLKSLKRCEQLHYACELTGCLHMEEKVKHLDWMVSGLSWIYI